MLIPRDALLLWQPWNRCVWSVILFWLLGENVCRVQAACYKLELKNTLYQQSREGTYQQTSSVCNHRMVYRQSNSKNYIYYMTTTGGWEGWMIGTQECTNSAGIAVETTNSLPNEVTENWEEAYEDSWYFNTSLTLKCFRISSGTIVGIIFGIVSLVSLVIFIAMRHRQRKQRQRMLRQPVRRTQVAVVGGRHLAGAPGGPRFPGPRPPGPGLAGHPGGPRPRGPPPPRMQQGYGHGPMVQPDYGNGHVMPPHQQGPMIGPPLGPPPSYPGVGAPMAPGYQMTMGIGPRPPPPYQANYDPYPPSDAAYPPPGQQQQQRSEEDEQKQSEQRSHSSRNVAQHGHGTDIWDTGTNID